MLVIAWIKKLGRVLYLFAIWLFSYTGVDAEAFSILGVFLFFDTLTGVFKVIAIGKKPTSRRFGLGVTGKSLMLFIPMLIALLSKVTVDIEISGLVKVYIGLLCTAEFYSIIQNMVSIRLQREIEEYDAITGLFTAILRFIKNQLDKAIPKT